MRNLINKTFLCVMLVCFTLSAQAQIRYGVKAGFNASSMNSLDEMFNTLSGFELEDASIDFSSKFKAGFHLGLIFQYNFENKLFIQPELLFSNQGSKLEAKLAYGGITEKDSESTTVNYLQLPIYVGYKFNAGQNLDIIAGVGPYLAYGIYASDFLGTDEDTFDILKRFDAGLSVMAGIEYDKLQMTLGFDLGLVDAIGLDGWKTAKDIYGLSSVCNRNIKVSVGYFF